MNIIEGEKMGDSSNVPDSSSPNTALGDTDIGKATTSLESTPSFQDANIRQTNETCKQVNEIRNNICYGQIISSDLISASASEAIW